MRHTPPKKAPKLALEISGKWMRQQYQNEDIKDLNAILKKELPLISTHKEYLIPADI